MLVVTVLALGLHWYLARRLRTRAAGMVLGAAAARGGRGGRGQRGGGEGSGSARGPPGPRVDSRPHDGGPRGGHGQRVSVAHRRGAPARRVRGADGARRSRGHIGGDDGMDPREEVEKAALEQRWGGAEAGRALGCFHGLDSTPPMPRRKCSEGAGVFESASEKTMICRLFTKSTKVSVLRTCGQRRPAPG